MPAIDEIFTGKVRDMTSDGQGVVEHAGGQVFFAPGVWPGESGRFRVTGFRKRNGFAELVELLESSPHRVEPGCPHHGFSSRHCGGCPWQFVSIDVQLAQKEARVRQSMARLGLGDAVRPIRPSPRHMGYRNRAQLKSDGEILGYMSASSNRLVAIDDCPVLTDRNRRTLKSLLAALPNPAWRPRKKHRWVTLDIDEDVSPDTLAVNQRRPFRQGNSDQNRQLREWLATRLAEGNPEGKALELFAGSGNLTEVIADAGYAGIHAVEGVAEAVEELESLALSGVTAEVANLFDGDAVRRLARRQRDARLLVLDPPRDGFRLMDRLLAEMTGLDRVIYVACDLATLTRDLAAVQEAGFRVREVQPLDMFPQTPHVEVMVDAVAGR